LYSALLVSQLEEPRQEIVLPDFVYDSFLEIVPELLRVGGPYMWVEKVTITGNIIRQSNRTCLENVTLIEFTDSKKSISFS
jgi:hypothetical protein